jgi:hypothetical protein
VKGGEDHDDIVLDAEVHSVRKPPEQSAADAGLEILVLERVIGNTIVRGTQLMEKLESKPGPLVLIPLVCGRNVEVDSRICNQPIRGHR